MPKITWKKEYRIELAGMTMAQALASVAAMDEVTDEATAINIIQNRSTQGWTVFVNFDV